MRHFTCSPDVKLLGYYVNAFVDNAQGDEMRPIMAKFGLVDLDPMGVYPALKWQEAMNEVARNPNLTSNFVAIGMKIGEIIPVPEEIGEPTFEKMIVEWGHAYDVAHPGGGAGAIVAEKIDDKHWRTIHTDLYPDDFMYGIQYTLGKRFLPKGTRMKVFYDDTITPRDNGGTGDTVIHTKWE